MFCLCASSKGISQLGGSVSAGLMSDSVTISRVGSGRNLILSISGPSENAFCSRTWIRSIKIDTEKFTFRPWVHEPVVPCWGLIPPSIDDNTTDLEFRCLPFRSIFVVGVGEYERAHEIILWWSAVGTTPVVDIALLRSGSAEVVIALPSSSDLYSSSWDVVLNCSDFLEGCELKCDSD